jgi:hypothetical protein
MFACCFLFAPKCCAICGIVKLNHQHKYFLKVQNVYDKKIDVDPSYTP